MSAATEGNAEDAPRSSERESAPRTAQEITDNIISRLNYQEPLPTLAEFKAMTAADSLSCLQRGVRWIWACKPCAEADHLVQEKWRGLHTKMNCLKGLDRAAEWVLHVLAVDCLRDILFMMNHQTTSKVAPPEGKPAPSEDGDSVFAIEAINNPFADPDEDDLLILPIEDINTNENPFADPAENSSS